MTFDDATPRAAGSAAETQPLPPTRQCLPCTACCVRLPVPAGMISPGCKPAGVACRHLGPSGCRIHDIRPKVCRGFHCAWRSDATWPSSWRPDLSGLLCLREHLGGELPAAAVYELRPGALETPLAAMIVDELRRTTAVVALIDVAENRRAVPGTWAAGPIPGPVESPIGPVPWSGPTPARWDPRAVI